MLTRAVLSRRLQQLEVSINGVRAAGCAADCRSALAARLDRLHERMAAAGMLHEVTSAEDVAAALSARLDAIARQSRQPGGAGA